MSLVDLVRAEVGRLAARRFVVVMLALLLGALAVTFATTVASTHAPSARELSRAQSQVELERQRLRQSHEECVVAQANQTGGYYRVDCSSYDPANARVESYLSDVFVFAGSIKALVYFLATFLALFGFLIGASFVGAELTSGGMTNLLLWRPQRITVLGTKLGVLLTAMLALSIPVTLGYILAFRLLAEVAGLPGATGDGFYASLSWLSVRGVVMAVGATALGFVLASVGRHTAAALGALAGYAVIWEVGGRIVTEMVRAPRGELLFLGTHLAAWLNGRIRLYDNNCAGFGYCDNSYDLTWWEAGPLMAVLLAGAVAAAFAIFRRRDLA